MCVVVRIDKSLNRGLHFGIIVLLLQVVFELQHFDPSPVNQNSRAPVDMKLRTRKEKEGCLQKKYRG
jgi:hypothetical protein